MSKEQTVYEENGYKDREDYFQSLAEENGVPIEAVWAASELLGEGEDFDGLVSSLDLW